MELELNSKNGWGLLRASNTTPVLVLRFEAKTERDLKDIKALFYENLKNLKKDIPNF